MHLSCVFSTLIVSSDHIFSFIILFYFEKFGSWPLSYLLCSMFRPSVKLFYFTILFEFSLNCMVHYRCLKSYFFTPSFLSPPLLFFSYLFLSSSVLFISPIFFSSLLFISLMFFSYFLLFFSYLFLCSSVLFISLIFFSTLLFISLIFSYLLHISYLHISYLLLFIIFISIKGMASAVVMSSVLGMIFYCIAFLVNDVKRSEAKVDKKALVRVEYLKFKEEHQNHLQSTSKDSIT